MNMQMRQEYLVSTAIFLTVAAVAVLWFLIPRVDNFGAISSSEVDRILYNRLDEYERAYEENAELQAIVTTALSNPDALTPAERQTYLVHERKFLAGWETALAYRTAGYFDPDRFEVWDEWYISEVMRRPRFAWTENKEHFAGSFIRHVDETLAQR